MNYISVVEIMKGALCVGSQILTRTVRIIVVQIKILIITGCKFRSQSEFFSSNMKPII